MNVNDLKDLIGKESSPVTVRIEDHAVRKFAEAVGIPFDNKVPPTFVITFPQGNIEGFNSAQDGMVHGEQKFKYYQPISVGDSITCIRQIEDVCQKTGKLGKMTFVITETKGYNAEGELVFKASSTLIFPEGNA